MQQPAGEGYGPEGPGMPHHLGGESVFPCVKLRGLPFDATEEEIRVFLATDPIDTVLVKREGRFSGEAYVVLSGPAQVQAAVEKNKSYMGRRYVEVFRAKKLDYYKAVMGEMLDGTGMGRRPGPPGPQQGMMMAGMQGGMQAGMQGYGAMGYGMGMQGYGGYPQAGGYVNGAGGGYGGGHAVREESNVLRLRGLPFSAGKDDIIAWFADIAVTPPTEEGVHIITDYGRPTGVALVEFATPQEAQAAMAKDKQIMGTRYIEVFMSSRDELQRYLPRSY
ncbi:heterogeneous nuclear ribonucleoprotein H3 [Raphidocelis subcapitata]|uniref:Heterogeneous nuclear ribonucleoprotein H3 n=1 Tax=Raphidocelis subcapitata TaxID=307507 RepID=A0A2V0P272_9CHLO|nr:heterogeneous nuclear ribonucleoprotein H3 [Raphidocelis subcapitata]|eukprot:GBF91297.1 heterogeneous nuclear ribonucleoprotein H3 [Raphidocelis subcapitata]